MVAEGQRGKTQEYQILSGCDVEGLGTQVNEKLVEDWSPLKGPFVFGDSICQAMALKADSL